MTNFEKVGKFMKTFGQEVKTKPGLSNDKINIFNSKKIVTKNTHGTGCTLSSAITTFYSCGKTLKKSCELGINYVNHAIMTSPNYGKGHGPITVSYTHLTLPTTPYV